MDGKISFVLLALVALASTSPTTKESHALLAKLRASPGSTANVAVIFKSDVSGIYARANTRTYATAAARITEVRQTLIEHNTRTQRGVVKLLESQRVSHKSFWITNRIIVSGADFKLAQALALHQDVAEIREEISFPVAHVERTPATKEEVDAFINSRQDPAVRGVFIVSAPQLWARNIRGQNLTVSNIDTGVRGTHRILRDNYLGAYGWFDPYERTATPNDQNGHGTHTMGTIAGRDGFGVAPEARWMACKGCRGNACYEEDLLGCAEFTACPTLPDGSSPNCSLAPSVSSNSWGSTLGGNSWYDDAIEGMKTAGVIVVFSAGNAGSGCGTVGSPGDRDVIGVAATDMDDVIASFSSRGPSVDGRQKPEISAPGVQVLSSVATGDEAFERYSGTSMACPHIAGGVALLVQNNPNLAGNQNGVAAVLAAGADQDGLTGSNQNCGGIPDSTFPNNVFGHGRMNLEASAGGGGGSSTAQPSTAQPSTAQPSTAQPSTAQPSSAQPSTAQPTSSAQPSTIQPSIQPAIYG